MTRAKGMCVSTPCLLNFLALSVCVIASTAAAADDCCRRLGFNFRCAGSSQDAPPLPAAAQEDGWWAVDHARVKVSACVE